MERTPAAYVGGEYRQAASNDTYLAVGYEGVGRSHADLPAVRVLEALLGSAVSRARFSAPGDGLTSVLRKKLLDKHAHAHEASAFNFSYSDTGLFGVFAKVDGDAAPALLNSMHRLVWDAPNWYVLHTCFPCILSLSRSLFLFSSCVCLCHALCGRLTDELVEKGKRSAALKVVRRLESRQSLIEYVGRELLVQRNVVIPDPHWQRAAFDAVTTAVRLSESREESLAVRACECF